MSQSEYKKTVNLPERAFYLSGRADPEPLKIPNTALKIIHTARKAGLYHAGNAHSLPIAYEIAEKNLRAWVLISQYGAYLLLNR